MKLLAIDPGETTGYATLDLTGMSGKPLSNGQMPYGQIEGLRSLSRFLYTLGKDEFDVIVIEGYTVLPTKVAANIGSTLETVQAVGVCKSFAYVSNTEFHISSPTKNPIYAKWSGMNPSKMGSHSKTHWVYAYNHGYGYMVEKGLINTVAKEKAKDVFG